MPDMKLMIAAAATLAYFTFAGAFLTAMRKEKYLRALFMKSAAGGMLFYDRTACAARMFAAGSICFVVSDNILGAHSFGNKSSFGMEVAAHMFYYIAQLLIAWSIMFI